MFSDSSIMVALSSSTSDILKRDMTIVRVDTAYEDIMNSVQLKSDTNLLPFSTFQVHIAQL